MFNLILHIGTHKTGTTSIQRYLASAEKTLLKEENYHLINNLDYNYLIALDDFKRLSEKMLSEPKNYIVSCERLSGNLFNGYSDVFDILSCFSQLEDLYRIKVIVFYREQTSFIESAYSQYIHQGGYGGIEEFLQNFSIKSIKYTQHIDQIKRALPKAELSIRGYGPKNALAEFIASAQLNVPVPEKNANVNRSYSFDAIKFAAHVNQYLTEDERLKMRQMLQPVVYKTRQDPRKVMSADKAEELKAYFAEDNQLLQANHNIAFHYPYEHIEGEVQSDEIVVLTKMLINMNAQRSESELLPRFLKLEAKLMSIYKRIKRKLF